MDPDIESRTDILDRPRLHAWRAPWDPPPRPAQAGKPYRRRPFDGRRLDEPPILGGYYDELGRGVD